MKKDKIGPKCKGRTKPASDGKTKPKYESKGFMPIRLTEDTLKRLGFTDSGKDYMGKTKWRIKLPYYYFQIQVVLGNYPERNPNCSIVSLYEAPTTAASFNKKGKRKEIEIKEWEQAIAWGVSTPERLRHIIVSLTQENL